MKERKKVHISEIQRMLHWIRHNILAKSLHFLFVCLFGGCCLFVFCFLLVFLFCFVLLLFCSYIFCSEHTCTHTHTRTRTYTETHTHTHTNWKNNNEELVIFWCGNFRKILWGIDTQVLLSPRTWTVKWGPRFLERIVGTDVFVLQATNKQLQYT